VSWSDRLRASNSSRSISPAPGANAVVYSAGTLGLLAIAILRALHPKVRMAAIARFDQQARLAEKLGAQRVIRHRPTRRIPEEVAERTRADPNEAFPRRLRIGPRRCR